MKKRQWQLLWMILLLVSGLGAWEWTTYTDYSYYNSVAFDGDIMWAATSGGLVKRDLAADTLQVYTTRDGLPRNSIMGALLDADGNPWFTQASGRNGIGKFDGSSFISYQPEQDYFSTKSFDFEGNLWCVYPMWTSIAYSRLSMFNGITWTYYDTTDGLPNNHYTVDVMINDNGTPIILSKRYEYFGDYFSFLGLGISKLAGNNFITHTTTRPLQTYYNEGVKALQVDTDGTVWAGSYRVISQYRDTTWTTFTPELSAPEQVSALLRAKDNTLWIGAGDGVYTYNGAAWNKYTTPYTAITALAQDSSGTIWAGSPKHNVKLPDGTRVTVGGLLRFNGTGFDTVHISDVSGIYDLTTDRDGGLWGAAYGGVIHVQADTVHTYTTKDGIPSGYVYSIAADSVGGIWLGTGEGLVRLYPGTVECVTFNRSNSDILNARVEEVTVDAQYGVWCGTASGISVYRSGGFTNYPADGVLAAAGRIAAITFGPDGSVWAGGSSGLVVFRNNNWQSVYSTLNAADRSSVGNAVMDTAGMIWIATSEGLVKYDGTEWTWYDTTTHGLPSAYITRVFIDSQERLWCATYDGGVCYTDGSTWTVFDTADGLGDMRTYWISQDESGTIWAGHYDCLSRFNGTTWEIIQTQPSGGLPYNLTTCIAFDNEDDAWLGYQGITEFDGTTWTNEYRNLPFWKVDAVAVDHENAVWVGTRQGLAKKTGSTWTAFDSASGLPVCSVNKLAVDSSGNVWAGLTMSSYSQVTGLARFNGSTWTVYDSVMGIGISRVHSIAQYGTTLYFGIDEEVPVYMSYYRSGIIACDGDQWIRIDSSRYSGQPLTVDTDGNLWLGAIGYYAGTTWHASTKPDYLPKATSGACDQNGILWFGTGNGVVAYDGTDWVHYSTGDGLADYDVRAVAVDKQDRKWFCTAGGVSVLEADKLGITDFILPGEVGPGNLTVSPNPFINTVTITVPAINQAGGAVSVMDRTGRVINELPVHGTAVPWDGRDRAGNAVAPGIYFCIVNTGDKQYIKRLVKTQ